VSENRVLRRIFGPKREEIARGWRRLHNEELHNLYASPNITRVIESRRMRWAGHVARMGDIRNAYNILVGKPERKIPIGKTGVDGKMLLEWILRSEGVDWIHLAQDRDQWRALANMVMNI
jgi:hypothetical protein